MVSLIVHLRIRLPKANSIRYYRLFQCVYHKNHDYILFNAYYYNMTLTCKQEEKTHFQR